MAAEELANNRYIGQLVEDNSWMTTKIESLNNVITKTRENIEIK